MPNPIILIVGRLSGPKNDVILSILRSVAPAVAQKIPSVRFAVIGGPVEEEHRQLAKRLPFVRFEGYQKDLKPHYRKAALVVGAGRVALEAMALRKAVVAIGERMYVGPLAPENVEMAKTTNFGDCWEKEIFDWPQMARDLLELLQKPKKRNEVAATGFKLLTSEYDLRKIGDQTEAFYQKVLLEKNLSRLYELPIPMYHRVVDKPPKVSKYNLHVTQENLKSQFDFLKNRGFEPITFVDLLSRRVPRKPVILTFDDGYEDNHTFLFPLLKEYGFKAVIYLLGNRNHKNNFWDIPKGEAEAPLLREKQILEMAKSGLVEFGAHSLNHAKLTELKSAAIEKEVAESKKNLEKFLGNPVVSFAYPYGAFNEEVKGITKKAGFTFGVAVNNGPARFGQDLMEIRRVFLPPQISPFGFWKKTSGFYHRYRKLLGK